MSMRGQLHLQHDSPSATDLLKKIFMIRGFSSYFNLVTLDSLNEVTLLQATIAQMLVCFNSKKQKKLFDVDHDTDDSYHCSRYLP